MSGNHRAPWAEYKGGPEYGPRSVKTGRDVCHARAEADYIEKYGHLKAVPVADDDYEAPRERTGQVRYDQVEMEAWVAKHSARLTQTELDVYIAFWVEKRSHALAAGDLDKTADQIYETIKRIRRKAGVKRPP